MSKNSREPKSRQAPTDGAISTADLSPSLRASDAGPAVGHGAAGGGTCNVEEISFLLADLAEGTISDLAVGQAIAFAEADRRIVATVSVRAPAIGYVPGRHVKSIQRAMTAGYTAWVSELPHRAVRVTVRW